MGLEQQGGNPSSWRCPACGESNSGGDEYCRKCGAKMSLGGNENRGGKAGKIFLVLTLVVFLLGLGVAGWYYFTVIGQKKVAQNYLSVGAEDFSKTINSINALSTEKMLEDEKDNKDLYFKQLREEKDRSEKALSEVREAKNKLGEQKKNKLVSGLDMLLAKYYEEAEKNLVAYDGYMDYGVKIGDKMGVFLKEVEKLEGIFQNSASDEEATASMKAMKGEVDKLIEELKTVTAPDGLKDVHTKTLDYIQEFSSVLGRFVSALEARNEAAFIQAYAQLEDFIYDNKTLKDTMELEKYYFDEMHKRFSELRQKADSVKTEFTKLEGELKTDVSEAMIEGW